jgi:phage FluMu protein Com
MAIEKVGSPEKIKITVVGEDNFNKLYDGISKENNLVKCPNCDHLISKISSDESKTLQHKGLKAIVDGHITMQCPQCKKTIEF